MPFLDWVNKSQARQAGAEAPYRLLDFQEQYGDAGEGDNLLIQGDNLEAVKALIPFYAGRVKCIYIDPPYNTQSAFEHYDDKLEHSQWLSMMYPRLKLLWDLLDEDGSLWISIDDSEAHYLKVLMDELAGRGAFLAAMVWQKRYSRENREAIGDAHEYVYLYVKNVARFKKIRNKLPLGPKQKSAYRNPNNHPNGPWRGVSLSAQGYRPNQMYEIVSPITGKKHLPPAGSCWKVIESEYKRLLAESRIYFGKDGNAVPSRIQYLKDIEGMVPWTWWPHQEVGHTDESKREVQELFGKDIAFDTPKPERLIERILRIATNEGDLVFDSFLGSGTTAAVAHKMGRRYIGIEMGDHARTHCIPRLQKVIEGEQGGISEAVNWKGGGSFRFYTLGDTVFLADGGINPKVRFEALAGYVWHFETGQPASQDFKSPFLGEHEGTGYYLLYNGILGDKRPQGGNVFTQTILAQLDRISGALHTRATKRVVYGEKTLLSDRRLVADNIVFKQIPYDIKAR